MKNKKIAEENNSANQKNANKGTDGINVAHKKMLDNKSEVLNPTSTKYWKSRGLKERPQNWQLLLNS